LFPGVHVGICLRHALLKLPKKLVALASPVRKALRTQFHTLLYRARQRRSLRVFALGQRLRYFVDHVTATAGAANGERVRRWFQNKKTGWYKPRQNIVYLSAELNRLCRIRVSTDRSIRGLSPVGGLILPLYSVAAHGNATPRVQSI